MAQVLLIELFDWLKVLTDKKVFLGGETMFNDPRLGLTGWGGVSPKVDGPVARRKESRFGNLLFGRHRQRRNLGVL